MAELSRRSVLLGGVAGLGMAGAAAGGALGAGWRPFAAAADADRRALVTRASGGNGMNVVLVVIDSVRADHVGAYGSSVRTPNLDALASSGTLFTRAYPEAMPTIPARRAVHTGMRTYPCRDWTEPKGNPMVPGWQPVPDEEATLAELLGQLGYTTVLLADNPQLHRPHMDFNRGFSAYHWFRGSKGDAYGIAKSVSDAVVRSYLAPSQLGTSGEADVRQYLANIAKAQREEDRAAPRLFTNAADTLAELKDAQPFLLVVDTFEPHEPFLPPEKYVAPYSDGYGGGIEPVQPVYGSADYLDEAQLERMRALYAGGVTYVDRWVGRLFDALAEQGLDDSTLVIVLSDHGILLGDHGLTGKPFNGTYPGLTDIMLMVRHPERGHGEKSDVNASTHDITPTILAALDVRVDGRLDGGDLLGPSPEVTRRKHATSIFGDTLWVRDERWLLVGRHYGTDNELYDYVDDPELRHDVAGRQGAVVRRMVGYAHEAAGGDIPHYKL